jgi:hypothetical protein
MTYSTYEFEIGRTDKARDLHDLHSEVASDDLLTQDEKDELCALIRRRFSVLNAKAAGPQRPRW